MPKESIEIALSTWDYILRVWAVAGPLLAGSISAVWSRRNQIQDRDYQYSRQLEKDNRLAEENSRIRAEEAKRKKYDELRDACLEFMASSHEYVRKKSEYMTSPTPELQDHAREANDRFTNSSQKIILLGNSELSEATIALWNATLTIPKSYNTPIDKVYQGTLDSYQSVRAAFNFSAKQQLESFE